MGKTARNGALDIALKINGAIAPPAMLDMELLGAPSLSHHASRLRRGHATGPQAQSSWASEPRYPPACHAHAPCLSGTLLEP